MSTAKDPRQQTSARVGNRPSRAAKQPKIWAEVLRPWHVEGVSRNGMARHSDDASALGRVAAWVSMVVPFAFAAWRLRSAPAFRDDLALIQGLGLVPARGQGGPSSLLMALSALLPVGGRVLRAGLASAIGAGIAGSALHGVARGLLRRAGTSPRLAPILAATAALAATSSTIWQREAIGPGGVTLAAGLCFVVLGLCDGARPRWGVGFGIVAGLVLAENRFAFAVLAAALALQAAPISFRGSARQRLPQKSELLFSLAGALATVLFFLLPVFVRQFASHASIDLGTSAAPSVPSAGVTIRFASLAARWEAALGPFAILLGGLGVMRAVSKPALRTASIPLAVFALAGIWASQEPLGALVRDPAAPLPLLATGALAIAGAVGVDALIAMLGRARLPFRAPAAVLLVVFHVTTAFGALETSSSDPSLSGDVAAEVWSDEALAELPPNALVLVRSPHLALRVWAGRFARGERPDLVVVPLDWVGQSAVARDVIDREPAAAALVRDVAMSGKTTEYALSALADARPLYVDLAPDWDLRLFEHLRPTPLWIGFAPHPLGRSDRTFAVHEENGRRALRRIQRCAENDPATLGVLASGIEQGALVLAELGDADNVEFVLRDLERVDPDTTFPRDLAKRLARRHRAPGGPVALRE